MTCRVTIDDGVNPPVVLDDGVLTLNVDDSRLDGGGAILRFLNGNSAIQERWHKRQWNITGEANYKPGLKDLITSGLFTLTIESGGDVDVYSCRSLGASESWSVRGTGLVSFSMLLEQA